jgi:two-component system response regulator RegX3
MDFKVLMIDDDEVIAGSTSEYFNMFNVKTAYVTSFEAAEKFLEENTVSLLLLDINLGDRSGFDLCKQVREQYDMPILFVSARTSDDDVLIALNIGGDDYIKKPYTLSILLAKVKTILDRYEKAREAAQAVNAPRSADKSGDTVIRLTDDICIDTRIHKLVSGDNPIGLKDMEYRLIHYLALNCGRVVTKEELLKNVWDDEFVGEGTIAVHVRHLREKIEVDPKNPVIIKTIWGVGYMLEEYAAK